MSTQVLDPNIMLLLQIIIAVASIIISGFTSYWIATRQGEMAATKYNLRERIRKEHARELIEHPLERLQSTIARPDALIQILESKKP